MSAPFVAEIRMFAGNFAPTGWAMCDGQILPISQNTALFSLLGTTYGGNGQTNFALPNLQCKSQLHEGGGFTLGQAGGEFAHTVTMSEMPTHQHTFTKNSCVSSAIANANVGPPTSAFWANNGKTA